MAPLSLRQVSADPVQRSSLVERRDRPAPAPVGIDVDLMRRGVVVDQGREIKITRAVHASATARSYGCMVEVSAGFSKVCKRYCPVHARTAGHRAMAEATSKARRTLDAAPVPCKHLS